MTAQQFIAIAILLTVTLILWSTCLEPRAVRLRRQLDRALLERDAIQEQIAECARQGVTVTIDIINDLSRSEKEIALLRRLIEREN